MTLLMPVSTASFLTLVDGHLMALALTTARHIDLPPNYPLSENNPQTAGDRIKTAFCCLFTVSCPLNVSK